jgi:hypothetical protein
VVVLVHGVVQDVAAVEASISLLVKVVAIALLSNSRDLSDLDPYSDDLAPAFSSGLWTASLGTFQQRSSPNLLHVRRSHLVGTTTSTYANAQEFWLSWPAMQTYQSHCCDGQCQRRALSMAS